MPTTWTTQSKSGYGWQYDQQGLAYDALVDNFTGTTLYYDAVGKRTVWVTQNKS